MEETYRDRSIKRTVLSDDLTERRKQILAALDRFDAGEVREVVIFHNLVENVLSEY